MKRALEGPEEEPIQASSPTLAFDEGYGALQTARARSLLFRVVTFPALVLAALAAAVGVAIALAPWLYAPAPRQEEGRVRSKASKTAEASTMGRYHNFICGLGPDQFASLFLPLHLRVAVRCTAALWTLARTVYDAGTGVFGLMLARTSFFDASIRYAVREAGVKNLVICGAGFDTRCLRMREDLASIKVFEVDTPETQGAKLRALERAGVEPPSNTVFCETNFNDGQVFDVLEQAGFDATLPTVLIWEGVATFLPQEVVDKFLEQARTRLAPGSFLVMDWLWDTQQDPERFKGRFVGHDFCSRAASNHGEPFLSGLPEPFEEATVRAEMAARDWEVVDAVVCAEEEGKRRYLETGDGRIVGRGFESDSFMLLRAAAVAP